MVTDPKEVVASNCPWPLDKKNEITGDYIMDQKNTINNNSISINTEIKTCNSFYLQCFF